MTAIVGSYPKPDYLYPDSGRKLLDDVGFSFYDLEKSMGTAEFQKRLERATVEAIADQNASGIDLVTDGEERRDHYVLYVLRKMAGIDFENLTQKTIRDGRYVNDLTGMPFGRFLSHGHDGLRATAGDWALHLTTLFPEVRLKTYLEIRAADSLPPWNGPSTCRK